MRLLMVIILFAIGSSPLGAATYEVGPGKANANIGDVPWESLNAGDTVLIYWRATPYREKWVIGRQGTAAAPITVRGVPDASGLLPIINGSGATTPAPLNFTNEDRGIIKIGSSNVPPNTTPRYIVIEDLDIRSARPAYSYTGDDGGTYAYRTNAGAVYVEKGENITIRGCVLHDCGNGINALTGATIKNLLIEGCYIYDNGIVGSSLQHNTYTGADGITYQYNRFGPLRAGCDGNNLKDRSAGCVIRYNWIESGNRQLDLVDGSGVYTLPTYNETFVYGNILIEPNGAGNSQIVHYGGDSGNTSQYRKGTLHFYNNTVVSTRVGNTTLLRLSSSGESADCRNNILYVSDSGFRLGLMATTGTLNFRNNWLKPGWVNSHNSFTGTINNLGGNVETSAPGFVDEAAQDYHLVGGSPCIDVAAALAAAVLPANDLARQYVLHQQSQMRLIEGTLDIGAFEYYLGSGPPSGFLAVGLYWLDAVGAVDDPTVATVTFDGTPFSVDAGGNFTASAATSGPSTTADLTAQSGTGSPGTRVFTIQQPW